MKNWIEFNENIVDYTRNQKRLREYIKILKDSDIDGIYLNYFIIIHNFLFIENKYIELVKICGKELNSNLNLPKLLTKDEVIDKFTELYDVNSLVRFSVETFDSIDEVRLFLLENPKIYNKIFFKI